MAESSTCSGSSMSDLVEHFCGITGASCDIGEKLLEACNGNLELAIEMHMEGGEGASPSIAQDDPSAMEEMDTEAAGPSGENDGDSVRAPIPQTREVLVEDAPSFASNEASNFYSGFRGRRRQPRSVFDRFRDFQVEAKQQEQLMAKGSSISKRRTLEDLFRPPIDITYKGSFSSARETGTTQNKWLLVNIQNVQEFQCQALNRDVWSSSAVKTIVKEHFIFWQVYHDSEEGKKYMQFYKIETWPYIAIVDPQTGENMVTWNKLDSSLFCDVVSAFLTEHPTLDGKLSTPPSKRLKREHSIVDASEDDQIQAAIKASLDRESSPPKLSDSIDNTDSCSNSDDLETFSDTDDEISKSPVKKIKSVVKNSANKSSHTHVKNLSCSNSMDNSCANTNSVVSEVPAMEVISDSGPSCSSNQESDSRLGNHDGDSTWEQYIGNCDDPKSNLVIRFPDGQKDQLSLSCSSKLKAIVQYVIEKGYSGDKYELLANFPRRMLSNMDYDTTIKDAGLHPQETIFVQAT